MSIEKLVEQDFQALEASAAKGEAFDQVALDRCIEQIQLIGDDARIIHWRNELRRIGAMAPEPVVEVTEDKDSPEETGGVGGL